MAEDYPQETVEEANQILQAITDMANGASIGLWSLWDIMPFVSQASRRLKELGVRAPAYY